MSAAAHDWRSVTALTTNVLTALDWCALGDLYFHERGEELWREKRPQVVELGIELAQRLLPQLAPGGTSLWVGAGVAELPVMLAEILLRQRTVVAANLLERECAVLNRGLAATAPDVALRYQAADAAEVASGQRFDHLGCISVFTDPERWPLLSGVAYGRLPPVQLDVERFVVERDAALALARALFARLEPGALVTTSAEEVAWFVDCAAARGVEVDAGDELIATAVVGDPVGFLRIG